MNLRQAAQQALKEMDDHMYRADTHEFYEAKEALRAALAEPEQDGGGKQMTRDEVLALAKKADLWMTSDERIAAVERFAALVIANNPPQSWMSYQEGYEAGKQAESAYRLQQEAWNIDSKYASLLALTLECMILDPRRWHDDAVNVLDQYRAEWNKLNPSPSPFGKD